MSFLIKREFIRPFGNLKRSYVNKICNIHVMNITNVKLMITLKFIYTASVTNIENS